MSIAGWIMGKGPNGFGFRSTAEQVCEGLDLSGKTFLLTGCNSGLGQETMRVLSARGGHIIALARTVEKAEQAIAQAGASGTPLACELSEPQMVQKCVEEVKALGKPLDVILCNAGIMALPELQQKYGLELQFLTNHIGHFILVTGLLDTLHEQGRVVMVSSAAHRMTYREGIDLDNLSGEKGYVPWRAYGQSKLANLLFTKQLSVRLSATLQTANALHPGVIRTNLGRHMSPAMRFGLVLCTPIFLKTIPEGAATQVYLAAHPRAADFSGRYYSNCNPARPSEHGEDYILAQRLWEKSEQIVKRLLA